MAGIISTVLILMLGSWLVRSQGTYQLGYTVLSCDDLKPSPIAAWGAGGSGSVATQVIRPINSGNPDSDGSGQPILMTTLSQYRISVSDVRYRKGRMMTVRVQGRGYFDGFLMEARALGGGPTSKSPVPGVGRWVKIPEVATFLNCRNRAYSAVTNSPSPVRMNNLTFTWEAPYNDFGDIYFIASVLLKDRYWVITSERLRINTFPGEISGCGSMRTCTRLCGYDQYPVCTLDSAEYVAIIEVDLLAQEATFTLGGRIRNESTYIALGFSTNYYAVEDMDMNVCMKIDGQVILGHYYVKSDTLPPLPHTGVIVPDTTDVDTDYIWCRFRRPLLNVGYNSIDPKKAMYHYYFKGNINETGLFLPPLWQMNMSPETRNISDFYSDIQTSNQAPARRPYVESVISVAGVAVFILFLTNKFALQ